MRGQRRERGERREFRTRTEENPHFEEDLPEDQRRGRRMAVADRGRKDCYGRMERERERRVSTRSSSALIFSAFFPPVRLAN